MLLPTISIFSSPGVDLSISVTYSLALSPSCCCSSGASMPNNFIVTGRRTPVVLMVIVSPLITLDSVPLIIVLGPGVGSGFGCGSGRGLGPGLGFGFGLGLGSGFGPGPGFGVGAGGPGWGGSQPSDRMSDDTRISHNILCILVFLSIINLTLSNISTNREHDCWRKMRR